MSIGTIGLITMGAVGVVSIGFAAWENKGHSSTPRNIVFTAILVAGLWYLMKAVKSTFFF